MSAKSDKVQFEEALNMTGFGRYNLVMLALNSSIIIAMAFETFSVAYLVPASACDLQTSSVNQGLMAGMPLFGILLTSNIWGYLADTKGRRKILIVSLTLGLITGSSATLSPNWIVFCFLKFASASAMSGTFGLAMTFLSECTPEFRRFTLIMLITSVYLSSAGCMAALTIPVLPLTFSYYVPGLDIHFNSWRLLNLIYSAPCALAAIGSYFVYESPKYLLSTGNEGQALEVLKKIFVINTRENREKYKVKSLALDEDSVAQTSKGFWSSVTSQTLPLLKPPLLKNTLLLSVLFVAVYFCLNPYMVWLPHMVDGFMKSLEKGDEGLTFCGMLRSSKNDTINLEQHNDCTLNQIAMTLVFSMDLLLAGLNICLIPILPCCGRKWLLITIQGVWLHGTAGLLINASTTWVLSAVLMITFMSGILNFGFLSTFSVDVFPTYVKAMGVCLTLMMGRGSAVLGINLLKGLLVNNCEASFYVFGGITIFGGFVGFLLPAEKEKTSVKKCAET